MEPEKLDGVPALNAVPHMKEKTALPDTNRQLLAYKVGRTAHLLAVWIVKGLCAGVTGCALLDLRDRLGCDTDLEELSRALAAGGAGAMFGAIGGGILIDRYWNKKDLMMGVCMGLMGLAVALQPWTRQLTLLAILQFIEMFGLKGVSSAANALLIELWDDKVSAPMHALHFAFSVGATISPLIARPFIASLDVCDANSTTLIEKQIDCNVSTTSSRECVHYGQDNNRTNDFVTISAMGLRNPLGVYDDNGTMSLDWHDYSTIEYPYAAYGLGCILVAVIFFVFDYCIPLPQIYHKRNFTRKSLREVMSPGSIAGGNTKYGILMLILICLFYATISAHGFDGFLVPYAVKGGLGFSRKEAALLESVSMTGFMAGRAVSIIVAPFVSIQIMLFIEVWGNMICTICLAIWGTQEKIYLWIFSWPFSFFNAPLWPGGYTWVDQYIVTTAMVVGVCDFGASLSGLFFTWLTGLLFTYVSPNWTMYRMVILSVAMCLSLAINQTVASRHGKRPRDINIKLTTLNSEETRELLYSDQSDIEINEEINHSENAQSDMEVNSEM